MIYIWPYKIGSKSAGSLATSLNTKRVRGHKRLRSYSTVVNWGSSTPAEITNQRSLKFINPPHAVSRAANKMSSFTCLDPAGVSIPKWTRDRTVAEGWQREGAVVYARHQLNAHSGRGIEVVTLDNDIPYAPLYVKGIVKAHEYRVHVGSGAIIDFVKKRRRDGGEANDYIKNLDNGWVFCRDNVTLPGEVIYQAVKAVGALGLDFGAVDVLYKDGVAYVLEVNTAPGLEGTTLQRYISYFKSLEG